MDVLPDPDVVSIEHVAKMLDISTEHAYRLANAGELPGAFRVGARSWEAIRLEAGARRPFDRRAFHMRLLRLGTMGLGPLRSIAAEELDGRG